MVDADRYVIGNAAVDPWVLNLEPKTQFMAERAINWQRVGQGQFDPPDYWRIVTKAELLELLPTMNRLPYTEEAWERFTNGLLQTDPA